MNSERTLWLAVLQTFLSDAACIRRQSKREQKWDTLWHEAVQPSTRGICHLAEVDFGVFLKRLELAYRQGYKTEKL